QMQKMDRPLTEEEQHTLKTYAQQLPRLWHAATTAAQERKRIVRCLIETVVVTAPKDVPHIKADIHWTGGQVTPIEVQRGRKGINCNVTNPELVDLIRQGSQLTPAAPWRVRVTEEDRRRLSTA